jgi:hypothetical protein
VTWSAELRCQGEYGIEEQILRNGELSIGRRFPLKEQPSDGPKANAPAGERLDDWSE